jgi:hypothetical protein
MYNSDKEVVFSFLQRVNYNESWEDIEYGLGYDFGDFNFGKGDSTELRKKIKETIKFMKTQFDGIFDNKNNTIG